MIYIRYRFMWKRLWIFSVLLFVFNLTLPADAHGYIVRAIPEDRAVLDRPPTRLQYWFSEGLEPEFSALNVRDQNGDVIASGGVSDDDDALMTVRLPNDLPDGAYVVELRPAFASDGHVIAESRVFFVGEEVGGVAGQAATDEAIPLEVAWKAVHLAATMLLFGAFTLYAIVLVPAWGSNTHAAGRLPPRVMRRLNVIIGYALLAAFAANGVALIQQTMTFFNIGFAQALNRDFIELVRIGSRFGDVWNWRMLFLGIIGLMFLFSLYSRTDQTTFIYPTLTAAGWVLALVLGSSSILSHAAGSLLWPWVALTVDWLHALAVGFWVGGLAVLVLILPVALRPYTGEQRRLALLAALRRFSPVAVACLLIVITTGIYSSTNWIFGREEAETTFGTSLAFKLILVGLLVAVGALHHIALRPERYDRFSGVIDRLGNWTRTLRLEAILAAFVLFGAAVLSATPVPVPTFAQEEVEAPTAVLQAGDLTVVMSVLPGGPGVNTFDTTVTRNGQRVDGLELNMVSVHPADDQRGSTHRLEPVEAGLYVTAAADIDDTGRWWTLLDISENGDDPQRLAFEWQITDEAAVIESIDPRPANILALLGVLLAVGYAMYPFMRRGYNTLELDAGSVSVAASAAIATGIALAAGYILLQDTRDVYDDALAPPPQVVNAVLPTQASLNRGETLYTTACATWDEHPADLAALQERLSRSRDEDIYRAIREGWRDLPACNDDLSVYERWDIVNYFRTFADTDET